MPSAADFVGIWSTTVPGTYWNYEFHPGAGDGDLFIQPDGTYTWYTSYGPNGIKTGSWNASSVPGYAITLHDPFENHDWNLEFKTEPSSIYLVPYKSNGKATGFYYVGEFAGSLTGAIQPTGNESGSSNNKPNDSLSGFGIFDGLIYAFSMEEPEGGSGIYNVSQLDWESFIKPLTGLTVGQSAAILVGGTFSSNNHSDTYSVDLLSTLTASQLQRLEQDFVLAVATTPGAEFSDATQNATRAVLPYGSTYAKPGFQAYYFGLSGIIGKNPSITVRQVDPKVSSYGLMLSFYRRDGVRDPAAAAGLWTPVSQQENGDFELIQFFPSDEGLGLDTSQAGIGLQFSRSIQAGTGRIVLISADGRQVIKLNPQDSSICTIQGTWALFSKTYCASVLNPGTRYRISIEGTPFTDLTGNGWSSLGRDSLDFSTAAALIRRPGGRTRLESEAGSVDVDDERQEVSGDFSEGSLDQRDALTDATSRLLERYRQYENGGSHRASEPKTDLLKLELNLGQSGKSTVATIQLASQVKATASVWLKPSGEAEDNTYDPRTGLGVELLDSDGNGLVDTLRVHLRDGGSGDGDGSSDGWFRSSILLAEAPRRTVYRFYNQRSGVHFYTPDAAERDNVIRNSYGAGASYEKLQADPRSADPLTGGWGYKLEGTAYEALDTQGTALYRFYNAEKRYHFLSTNAEEANTVIRNSVGAGYDLSNGINKDPIAGGWGYK